VKTNEERLAAIEVAIQFQADRLQDFEKKLDVLLSRLDEKQARNGAQDVSIAKMQTILANHDDDIHKLSENLNNLAKKVYWLLGIFTGIQILLQFLLQFLWRR